jgi:hypothetical protein
MTAGFFVSSFRDAPSWRRPEIHNPESWLWISAHSSAELRPRPSRKIRAREIRKRHHDGDSKQHVALVQGHVSMVAAKRLEFKASYPSRFFCLNESDASAIATSDAFSQPNHHHISYRINPAWFAQRPPRAPARGVLLFWWLQIF